MDQFQKAMVSAMLGSVAIFIVAVLSLQPPTVTGNASWKTIFRGASTVTGACTSQKDTCSQGSFCNAKLMVSQGSKLKGIYRGECIQKYSSGRLCKYNFQCQSNICLGIQEIRAAKIMAPQIGGCA